jgi:acyl-CoA synthetase (AMP-forming)/AMP-acid ligase II
VTESVGRRPADLAIPAALASRATADPESIFLIFGDESVTFGQMETRAEALAASLHGLGIEPGDRVAVVMPAWPEFVISMFAVAKLGAVLVPLNPRLTADDLRYTLRHSEAVAAITAETFEDLDFLQLFEELLVQLPALHYLVTVGEEDLWYDDRVFQFEDLLSAGGGRDYAAGPPPSPNDLFAIVYTAGTTGKPKGVELTHANLLQVAGSTADVLGLGGDDRVVGIMALFHVFGLGPGILGSLLSGATLILQDEFGPAGALDLVERHRATVHYGVPTLFVAELREQTRAPRDLDSLRLGLVAGAPVSDELVKAVEEKICPELLIAYSLTETSSTVCVTRSGDPGAKRIFTVGRPLENNNVRIVDPDGAELPPESVGEIAVRGPGVMRGYYRQPLETSNSVDPDGYLLTGDLGMEDEEGFIHLVGRMKEVIIRSGSNVYPREVEDRLHSHPAIREAMVAGVPDELLGEAICACVLPEEGAIVTGQEIKDWCSVTLADYKVPDVVQFMDEFPLTGTGRIQRAELSRLIRAAHVEPKK